jgi:phosphopantetheine adenylyltransferase
MENRDHQPAAFCESQLITTFQMSGEMLQEFMESIEHLAHQIFVGLPVDFMQREVAYALIDGVRDGAVKQNLLMGEHFFKTSEGEVES